MKQTQFLWLSAMGQRHQQFCRIESLEMYNPKLGALIKQYPKLFWDGTFCYCLTKGGYVVRWLDFLPKHFVYEKHRAATDKRQKKLLPMI